MDLIKKPTLEHTPPQERLRELLIGKQIVQAEMSETGSDWGIDGHQYDSGPIGLLTLSDGTTLKVWGNDGGCSCSAGCYPLAHLGRVDGTITNVEVEEEPEGDDYVVGNCDKCEVGTPSWDCEHRGFYRVFAVAENDRVLVASFEGSDGNGYYGSGWWLQVQSSEEPEHKVTESDVTEPEINYHYINGLVDTDPLALRDLAVRLLVERDVALARAELLDSVVRRAEAMMENLRAALADIEPCDHEWVDPSNAVVESGDYRLCLKCRSLAVPEAKDQK